MIAPSLAAMPSMDDIKIGPGGQTFGQLKDRVVAARAAYMACETDQGLEDLLSAVAMLRAAYTRVGLPYVAP